jgi:hypothetical protein
MVVHSQFCDVNRYPATRRGLDMQAGVVYFPTDYGIAVGELAGAKRKP